VPRGQPSLDRGVVRDAVRSEPVSTCFACYFAKNVTAQVLFRRLDF
jgi:hypothetical protein